MPCSVTTCLQPRDRRRSRRSRGQRLAGWIGRKSRACRQAPHPLPPVPSILVRGCMMTVKVRDASKPFRWEDLSPEEQEAARRNYEFSEVVELLDRLPADPNASMKLLALAEECLREHRALPAPLAAWLAKAFERTIKVCERDEQALPQARAQELARALSITAPQRRPAATTRSMGPEVFRYICEEDLSASAACRRVASEHGVSVSTVKSRWREWRDGEGRIAWESHPRPVFSKPDE